MLYGKKLQLLGAFLLVNAILLLPSTIDAQNTFTQVYNILQSNCAGSGCHSGANAETFRVDLAEGDVYAQIVGAQANNPAAAAKGMKLVDPGQPYKSFLLRKIGGDLDSYLALHANEGDMMPTDSTALPKAQVELIRQWIMKGAQETGNVVTTQEYQMIQDYYANGGLQFIQQPEAPDPSEGIQLRYGPIFIEPSGEVEYMKKLHVGNETDVKVWKMDGVMSWQSHHMLLFKDGPNNSVPEGMRKVPIEDFPFNHGTLTGAWQDDEEFELPEGSAFFWEAGTQLDFDYHIRNYDANEILPADFYLNIYYADENDNRDIEMLAELVNEVDLLFSQGIQHETREHVFNEDRYIWLITSHAHERGTDYDIYVRNPDGSKGEQIYEGFYNSDYTFNQGYWDWEHPAIRRFDPLKKVSHGLIHEATWNITGPCTSPIPLVCVSFGLTTDDEMMLMTYLYTKEPLPNSQPTGIEKVGNNASSMNVYPNPFTNSAEVDFNLTSKGDVELEVYNLLGKKITTLINEPMGQGAHSYSFDPNELDNNSGVFFIMLKVNGQKVSIKKVTKL